MQGSRPPARPPPDSSRPRAATSASRAAWARGPAPGGPGRRSAASGAGRARAGVRARTPAPGPGPGPSERGKGRAPPAAPHLSNVENPNTSFKHLGNIRPPGTAHAPRRHRPLPRGPRPRRTHAPSQPRRPGVGLFRPQPTDVPYELCAPSSAGGWRGGGSASLLCAPLLRAVPPLDPGARLWWNPECPQKQRCDSRDRSEVFSPSL
ncbi:hypothetical protein AB1E18_009327 [Capra hircus]